MEPLKAPIQGLDWKKIRPILQFILILVGVYFGLNALYKTLFLTHYTSLAARGGSDPFTHLVAQHAVMILQLFGYDASSSTASTSFGSWVSLSGVKKVIVVPPCSGAKNLFLLLGLLLAFPGPIRKKIWFIPLALVVFHLSNALRIAILTLIYDSSLKTHFGTIEPIASYVSHLCLFLIFVVWLKISLKKS